MLLYFCNSYSKQKWPRTCHHDRPSLDGLSKEYRKETKNTWEGKVPSWSRWGRLSRTISHPSFLFFWNGSHYVAQAGFNLAILLPQFLTCLGYTPLSSDLSPSLRKHLQQLQEGHFTLSGNQQRIFGVILIGEQSLQTIKIQRCWTREFINETLFLPETRLETNVLWQISLWGSMQGPWGSTPPHPPSTPSQAWQCPEERTGNYTTRSTQSLQGLTSEGNYSESNLAALTNGVLLNLMIVYYTFPNLLFC